MKILAAIKLMRPQQWYKNLVIFLPLLLSNLLFTELSRRCIAAFFIFSIASSINYVFNDIKDRKKDRLNPEKKGRPIAAKVMSVKQAKFFAYFLLSILIFLTFNQSLMFNIVLVSFIIITQIYTLKVKQIPYVELFFISINFVLRLVAGGLIVNAIPDIWLTLGIFIFALYLFSGKRLAEYGLKNALKARLVLKKYQIEQLEKFSQINLILLILIYGIFANYTVNPNLLFTWPLFIIAILRFNKFLKKKDKIARHPHLALKDPIFTLFAFGTLFAILYLLY